MGMGVPEMLIFLLFPALLIGGAVVLAVLLIGRSGSREAPRSSTALMVLEERYARGEITREEFLDRREVLRQG